MTFEYNLIVRNKEGKPLYEISGWNSDDSLVIGDVLRVVGERGIEYQLGKVTERLQEQVPTGNRDSTGKLEVTSRSWLVLNRGDKEFNSGSIEPLLESMYGKGFKKWDGS